MNWYVLRVMSGKEDEVAVDLSRRAEQAGLKDGVIERVLVPTEKVSEIKGGKKRIYERKIFPGYIMVRMDITQDAWYLIHETPGIGDFVGASAKPVPMSDEEVGRIITSMEEKQEKPKLKIEFRKGDAVKIKEGSFENFDGVVDEVNAEKGSVNVLITIFGRATPVELEYWKVEPL